MWWFGLLGCLGVAVSRSQALVLGVDPTDQSRYLGTQFRCFDGSGPVLPVSAVNDEFCDCPDGSDEPGTGACAGQETTTFFCVNDGSIPRRVFASRVGDGICDCCDGSDELSQGRGGRQSICPNKCAEQGVQERQQLQKRVEDLRAAIAKGSEVRQTAVKNIGQWKQEVEVLQGELPALEEALKTAEATAEAERKAQAELDEAKDKARQEAEQQAEKDNELVNAAFAGKCQWRQTAGCSATGDREPALDTVCSRRIESGASGFCDCDGDEQKGVNEPGFDCDTPRDAYCASLCKQQISDNAAKDGAKPEVSEYTKWMEGAEEAMTAEEGNKEADKPQVSEYTKWMEGAQEAMAPGSEADAAASSDTRAPAAAAGNAIESAAEIERNARQAVNDHKDAIRDLKLKIDALPEDKLEYASLIGQTLTKKVSDFTYKLTFFDQAKQDYTSLGRWKTWTGPTSGAFENGQACWDGPERQLQVKFQCEVEPAVMDVSEPSKCVYEAVVGHPAACTAAELDMLTLGSRVIGPREEL